MQVSDFNYDLPQELIAQTPMEPRDIPDCWLLIRKQAKWNTAIFTICQITCALMITGV